mmetsp:Transcript_63652/g.194673  ORF Transcript_63652/g.194673 Transcript_63652/m.194673 type:complete len:222 (-) Transcript_63652:136-801(-)
MVSGSCPHSQLRRIPAADHGLGDSVQVVGSGVRQHPQVRGDLHHQKSFVLGRAGPPDRRAQRRGVGPPRGPCSAGRGKRRGAGELRRARAARGALLAEGLVGPRRHPVQARSHDVRGVLPIHAGHDRGLRARGAARGPHGARIRVVVRVHVLRHRSLVRGPLLPADPGLAVPDLGRRQVVRRRLRRADHERRLRRAQAARFQHALFQGDEALRELGLVSPL